MLLPPLQWLLDGEYAGLHRAAPSEHVVTLPGTSEGRIVDLLETMVQRFPAVSLSCLPHFEGDYRETELALRGERTVVDDAWSWLHAVLDERGIAWCEREATAEPLA